MAHKNHWHSSDRHHKHHTGGHHGAKQAKKITSHKHEDKALKQGNLQAERSHIGVTWFSPILDPSGQFAYIAMEMPNGEYRYQIAGPQAYPNYTAHAYPQASYFMPNANGDFKYASSNPNVSYLPNGDDRYPRQAETLETVEPGQILIETYPNNDINIVTPHASENSTAPDVVLIVQAKPDVEVTPVASHFEINGNEMVRRVERGSSKSRGVDVDVAVVGTRAQSKQKVFNWLSSGHFNGTN